MDGKTQQTNETVEVGEEYYFWDLERTGEDEDDGNGRILTITGIDGGEGDKKMFTCEMYFPDGPVDSFVYAKELWK